jgi:hypothetical protein
MKALAHHVSSLAVPFVLAASLATAQTVRPVSGSPQRIWFVDEAAALGGSGTRRAPFRTIQEGIDAARDGDRVLVAPGVYVERIDFLGKAIAVMASEGPAVTSIGKKFPVGTAVGVVFENGEGPDSVIDGFTIEDYIGFESAVLCIDYRLTLDSPLLDEGPAGQTGGIDAIGNPRVLDGDLDGMQRVDIGALEHDSTRLSVYGGTTLRGTVTFTTTAPSGWNYMLFVSPRSGDTPAPPYGSFLLALGGLRTVGSGTVPHEDVLSFPPTIALLGQELWAQSLALAPGGAVGNLSNALRLVIH